jgi:hypothetical protein
MPEPLEIYDQLPQLAAKDHIRRTPILESRQGGIKPLLLLGSEDIIVYQSEKFPEV